jgi:hypothetical protein
MHTLYDEHTGTVGDMMRLKNFLERRLRGEIVDIYEKDKIFKKGVKIEGALLRTSPLAVSLRTDNEIIDLMYNDVIVLKNKHIIISKEDPYGEEEWDK